ncbi:15 kDa selenoprotein [Columba livia]|uniref:15 kDa selenoprotein n=1 Tax=Columba livia TaxID=8932 RepID=A0A2I0MDX8_COLLI|nr:15 kDa selenoprotein [Columba livia]
MGLEREAGWLLVSSSRRAVPPAQLKVLTHPSSRDMRLYKTPLQMFHYNNYQISVYGTQLSSEACRELGFSSNLLCSSCNLLGQFNLNQLDPFCRQCCQEEAQLETRKLYAGAVLEVCG